MAGAMRYMALLAAVTTGAAQTCQDDPTYFDVWSCTDWLDAFPCRQGYGAVNTQARIDALVAACPVSCVDVSCPTTTPTPAPSAQAPIIGYGPAQGYEAHGCRASLRLSGSLWSVLVDES